jgi:hypothetical protein
LLVDSFESMMMHGLANPKKGDSSFAITYRFTVSLLQCPGVTKASKSNRTVVASQFCVSTFHFTAFRFNSPQFL